MASDKIRYLCVFIKTRVRKMFDYDMESLDIRKIADSGQTFRMSFDAERSLPDAEVFRCIAMDKQCFAGEGRVWCPDGDDAFWKNYFDLETSYEGFISAIDGDDEYLKSAAECGRGIRILRQDPWEMLITFIISQRRSIPSIKTCVEALCTRFGTFVSGGDGADDSGFYAFPTPAQLAEAPLDQLGCCSLGYRTEYVYLAAKAVDCGSLDLKAMQNLSDTQLLETLMSLRGVGPKVANCVSLFGFYRIGAFPIDVWIDRVLKEHYPNGFPLDRYKGFAGVMQQYMFYAARK